jgi:hypothetical protein
MKMDDVHIDGTKMLEKPKPLSDTDFRCPLVEPYTSDNAEILVLISIHNESYNDLVTVLSHSTVTVSFIGSSHIGCFEALQN